MQRIITLSMGARPIRVFSDILTVHRTGSPHHSHRYPEVHIFLEGTGVYTVAGQRYRLLAGDVILIPAGVLHVTECSPDASVTGFETDLDCDRVRTLRLPDAVTGEICEGVGRGHGAAIPALCYLFARLLEGGLYAISPNGDHAYLIDAFIEKNYHRPARLSELSAELCLSERQTQRVIKALTGGTFLDMLTAYRLKMAKELAATTDMPWSQIATYVGFSTYSGFRRALLRAGGEAK